MLACEDLCPSVCAPNVRWHCQVPSSLACASLPLSPCREGPSRCAGPKTDQNQPCAGAAGIGPSSGSTQAASEPGTPAD